MLLGFYRLVLLIAGIGLVSGCAVRRDDPPPRIALLAPFEGENRGIGYDALYAARLAFADADTHIELYPIDDGGTIESAVNRAEALAGDPLTAAVIILGQTASAPQTLTALADLPMLIVGEWGVSANQAGVFVLSAQELTADDTHGDFRRDTVYRSSALSPTFEFAERITGSDPFAPTPGLYSMLTYDAAHIAIAALRATRSATETALAETDYTGLNGRIRFSAAGYWLDAPIYTYHVTRLPR